MKVIQIVQEFSRGGGVESVAYELDRAWRAAGQMPGMMACVFQEEHPAKHPVASWLSHMPTRGSWRHIGRLVSMPLFAALATQQVRRLRKRNKGVVFLSHGDTFDGDICVVHAVNQASVAIKRRNGEWRWRLNPMHVWVHHRDQTTIGGGRYRRLVAVSRRVAVELSEHYNVKPEMIEFIPNGVSLSRFSPTPDDRTATRQALGLPLNAPTLLFVGHEFGRKGLSYVLEALIHLPQARLIVVGSGEQQQFQNISQNLGVRDRVLFLGARNDLPELNRAADAFVLPTAYETFALVCIEAMACGLPVFATAVGGIEDYLRAGVNGYPIERNGEAIANVLRPLLLQPEKMSALRQGAVETSRQYDWKVIAQRYQELIAKVSAEIQR